MRKRIVLSVLAFGCFVLDAAPILEKCCCRGTFDNVTNRIAHRVRSKDISREPAGLYVDVTRPPYSADKTGRTDCTKALVQALDDILVRTVEAYEATVEKMQALSDKGSRDVYLGLETARMQDGKLIVVYPEYEPPTRIVYFPKGTYLIGDTLTYSLKNLKARHYVVPYFDICRNIHFLGEDRSAGALRPEAVLVRADGCACLRLQHEFGVQRDRQQRARRCG